MTKQEIDKFLAKILALGFVFAPQKIGDQISVQKVKQAEDVDWSGDLTMNGFKSIFVPAKEVLFENGKAQFNKQKKFAWGMNILDLQAFTLFEQVFEKDVYYQKRRQNTYVIGFTNGLPEDFRKYKVFHQKYEEDVLEHVIFDVFIERKKDGAFVFFSGSEKGQRLLDNCKIKDYENIEFAGLVPEKGPDPRIAINRQAVEDGFAHELWKELDKKCLACGKCTIACPTCFCFDQQDEPQFEGVKKTRQWGSCFFPEFSKTAGGNKDLDSVKKKIYYWYYHKFVRIPDEFSYYGCVSCMRCFKACPVGINIAKNLVKLKNIKTKEHVLKSTARSPELVEGRRAGPAARP
jgi:sulfhydrogenase subunit beta (sulfur reductase)